MLERRGTDAEQEIRFIFVLDQIAKKDFPALVFS